MDDRRAYPRIDDRNSVAVTVLNATDAKEIEGHTFFCLTENISGGGIMLNVGTRVQTGSNLKLRIAFAHPIRSFDMNGRVAWLDESGGKKSFGLGVEFAEDENNDLSAWKEIVRRKVGFRAKQAQPESTDEPS